jgi:hypothetical protein
MQKLLKLEKVIDCCDNCPMNYDSFSCRYPGAEFPIMEVDEIEGFPEICPLQTIVEEDE